jgi:hypothetical protein
VPWNAWQDYRWATTNYDFNKKSHFILQISSTFDFRLIDAMLFTFTFFARPEKNCDSGRQELFAFMI